MRWVTAWLVVAVALAGCSPLRPTPDQTPAAPPVEAASGAPSHTTPVAARSPALIADLAGATPPVRVTVRAGGPAVAGATRYVIPLECAATVTTCRSADLPGVTSPYGPPTLKAQDVTGDGVPELIVQYGVGGEAAEMTIYQHRGGAWARIMDISGHPFVAPMPGGASQDVLSSTCCPPQGWGYRWNPAEGFVPLPNEQVAAAFLAAGYRGLAANEALAAPQPIVVVAPSGGLRRSGGE